MADNKDRIKETERKAHAPAPSGQMTEASPDPHSETATTDKSITTDHRGIVGKENVAQTPSTVEGQLNPSVTGAVEGGTTDHDSIFNEVAPQTGLSRKEHVEAAVEASPKFPAAEAEGPGAVDHDSMFNEVDPQTSLARDERVDTADDEERSRESRKRVPGKKTA